MDATLVGTAGADRLVGTPGRDVIWAGRGKDVILAGGGRDGSRRIELDDRLEVAEKAIYLGDSIRPGETDLRQVVFAHVAMFARQNERQRDAAAFVVPHLLPGGLKSQRV